MNCRHCAKPLRHVFLDLGSMPPSNDYLSAADLAQSEKIFPLRLFICDSCWLAQTEDFSAAGDLFRSDYAYFSSTSSSWLAHAAAYSEMITQRLLLNSHSLVIEVASNDGYLLKNFVARKIPCLGIEPTASTADASEKLGIPVMRSFFGKTLGEQLAQQGKKADLIIGNNVFAHVPDINDFTAGLKAALKPRGTLTLEFPHLMQMLAHSQFDTVYHEHYSYLSLHTAGRIMETQGLRVFDVEELPTHGGSLRLYICHHDDPRKTSAAVHGLLQREEAQGLKKLETYQKLQAQADKIRDDLRSFLQMQKDSGKKIAAYGAAAKGNTLLNYAGITPELLPYVCDAAPSKQGKFMPGSHIPILPPQALAENKPDTVLILPWNIATEVMRQQSAVAEWNGKFAVAVPEMKILEKTQ